MCPGTQRPDEGHHLLQSLASRAEVPPPPVPLFAHHPRLFEHLEVEGHGGLWRVEDPGELTHAAISLREELKDAEASRVREGVKPLCHVRPVEGERVRSASESRPGTSQSRCEKKQAAAAHAPMLCRTHQQLWICSGGMVPQEPDKDVWWQPFGPDGRVNPQCFQFGFRESRDCVF